MESGPRDLRFDAVIATGSGGIVLGAAVPDNEGAAVASARRPDILVLKLDSRNLRQSSFF